MKRDRGLSRTAPKRFKILNREQRQQMLDWVCGIYAESDHAPDKLKHLNLDDRINLPERLHSATVGELTYLSLPMDRFQSYVNYDPTMCTYMEWALRRVTLDEARVRKVICALKAIEPYPSKRPIEGWQIWNVLRDVGNIH